ncbi:MAG: hypothetical protein K5656_08645 [Lachnospiraceae bacterium]|nr:hypothetical protein [Lachnospiraceae bacterium]
MKEFDDVIMVEPVAGVLSIAAEYNDELFKSPFIIRDEVLADVGVIQSQNAKELKKACIPMQNINVGMSFIGPEGLNTEGTKNGFQGWVKEISENLTAITENESYGNQDNVSVKFGKVISDQMKLAYSEDYLQCMKINPIHNNIVNGLGISFPTPLYATKDSNGQIEYKEDYEKYHQLIEKYGFLKILERNQNFTVNETLKYVKAKKDGSLTEEQAKNYKNSYIEHIKELRKDLELLKNIDLNDECVKGNKFVDTNDVNIRWKNEAANYIKQINRMEMALGNGWPIRDYGVLLEIINMHDNYQKKVKDSSASKKERNEAQGILDEMKESYEALFNSKITDNDVRKKLLNSINEIAIKNKDDKLSIVIEDTLKADIPPFEIGINNVPANAEYDGFSVINDVYGINDNARTNSSITVNASERSSNKDLPNVIFNGADLTLPRFNIKDMKKKVDLLYKNIKDVDYFMFGKSSEQFNDMMKSISDTKEQIDLIAKRGGNADIYAVGIFADLLDRTRNNVIRYLDKKEEDFRKDATRRDDASKQTREQNRIQTAVESLEVLSGLCDETKTLVEDAFVPTIEAQIDKALKAEEDKRAKTDISPDKFKFSLVRTLDMISKQNSKVYRSSGFNTMQDYIERMREYSFKPLTVDEAKEHYKNSQMHDMVKKMIPDKEVPKSKEDNSKNAFVDTSEVRYVYNNAVKNMAKKLSVKNEKTVNKYKENLYSNQRKEQISKQAKGPTK